MGCKSSKADLTKERHSGEGPSSCTSGDQGHENANDKRLGGDTITLSGATPSPQQEVDLKCGGGGAIGDKGETGTGQQREVDAAPASSALVASKADAAELQTDGDVSVLHAAVFEDENPLEGKDLDPPDDCESVIMKNGVRYRGEWKNGKQHGRGVQRQPDGVRYTGQFVCGRIEGFGRLERPDGSKYEGEFHEGKAHTTSRSGVYTFSDGSKYIGQWVADKRHGVGKEVTVEGSVYEGQFKNGSKHGQGRMKSPNGDIYEGEFCRGDMNGTGRYVWPDGRMYQGEWSMSRMHGQGVFLFADGRRYEGEFQDSKMQNEGKLTWPDGSWYEGGFKGGLPHGRGVHKAAAEPTGRAALWHQGVRVKWLDQEDEEEGEKTAESEVPTQTTPGQQSEGALRNEQVSPKKKDVEDNAKRKT